MMTMTMENVFTKVAAAAKRALSNEPAVAPGVERNLVVQVSEDGHELGRAYLGAPGTYFYRLAGEGPPGADSHGNFPTLAAATGALIIALQAKR